MAAAHDDEGRACRPGRPRPLHVQDTRVQGADEAAAFERLASSLAIRMLLFVQVS